MHLLDTVKQHLIKIKTRINNKYLTGNPDHRLIAWSEHPEAASLSKWWQQGIPNIDDVLHTAKHPRSTTLKWFGMDTEKSFENTKPPHADWNFTKDNVNYTFNSLGYRGAEPDKDADYKVLLVGDSHGFGVGLDDKQIWAHQLKMFLQEQYSNCNIINLSLPGGSNDWIGRTVSCAYDSIKPDCVIVCYTYPNRREAIWDSGLLWQLNTSIPKNPVQSEYEEFQSWFMTINEHSDYYNLMRNHQLVSLACRDAVLIESHVTDLQVIQTNLNKILGYNDVARDCKHFGPKVHQHYADKIFQMFKDRQKQK